ncbi:maleylacetoacetate isomerase [Indioceanicola profundi]|uniref:maleylacetoacetate isomerase n=1 Tax=Indioceanicola profundi TaxID=2220096 RepID=UPI000E6AC1D3|nr:maleylacetoacetate isomerase [Indioceanicola profundi]
MKLYTYFRSSAAYRVRIALNLKGLGYEAVPVHLLKDGGEHLRPEYRAINPLGLVPSLEDAGNLLTQSLAIVEYLEETRPEPALLPKDALARARVRAFAHGIACDIHPINNLRILKYLRGPLHQGEDQVQRWIRTWVETGMNALERMVDRPGRIPQEGGRFCFGDTPGMADLCLIPQMFNARRFECDLSGCPTLVAIDAHCRTLPAFADAAPENQPDAA